MCVCVCTCQQPAMFAIKGNSRHGGAVVCLVNLRLKATRVHLPHIHGAALSLQAEATQNRELEGATQVCLCLNCTSWLMT